MELYFNSTYVPPVNLTGSFQSSSVFWLTSYGVHTPLRLYSAFTGLLSDRITHSKKAHTYRVSINVLRYAQ